MKPNTRIDNFLAKIAGDPDANTAMKPRSPEEYYLNQIAENGGGGGTGGGVLIVHDNTGTLDKTWQEIYDAVEANKIVLIYKTTATPDPYPDIYDVSFVTTIMMNPEIGCAVVAVGINNGQMAMLPYVADSADGYPTFD